MRRTFLICTILLAVGLTTILVPGCQTKTETVTAPDGTVTVTETSEVDQAAIAAIVGAAQALGTTAANLATQIAGIEAQIGESDTDDDTDWVALLNELVGLYNSVTAEKTKLEVKARTMVRAENVRSKGVGAFYVDPFTGDAVCNTESVK